MKWLKNMFKTVTESTTYKKVMDAKTNIIYIVTIGTLIIIDTFVKELPFWVYIIATFAACIADDIINRDPSDDDDDDEGHPITDGA